MYSHCGGGPINSDLTTPSRKREGESPCFPQFSKINTVIATSRHPSPFSAKG